MTENTAFIGIDIIKTGTPPIKYISDYNILELDYLYWDTRSFKNEYETGDLTDILRTNSLVLDKTDTIIQFSRQGGNVIIFTGGNTESINEEMKLEDYTILKSFKPKSNHGKTKTFNGTNKLKEILSEIYYYFQYYTTLHGNTDNSIISVPKTNEVVATYYITDGNGIVLAMPSPIGEKLPTLKIKELVEEIKKSHRLNNQNSVPEWTNQYQLPLEHQKIEQNKIIESKIKELKKDFQSNINIIVNEQRHKMIFASHDKDFESESVNALRNLGFEVKFGPETHCDVICRKGNTILAVEAKGLKKSSKPGNAAQCRRWVNDILGCLDQTEEEHDPTTREYARVLKDLGISFPTKSDDWAVKGVVLINTFREKLLEERDNPSEPSFNERVCEIMKRDKMCGLTGIQLLNLALEAQNTPEKADQNSDLLISTDGELTSHKNWDQFLVKRETN